MTYLRDLAPPPTPDPEGLQTPFWDALQREELLIQRCQTCRTWIFAPEWICHHCHGFDLAWTRVQPEGLIYSWTRVWRPAIPALVEHAPFLAVVVELPGANGIRLLGNLLGDPHRAVMIGAPVHGVFEHHSAAAGRAAFSLLQWKLIA